MENHLVTVSMAVYNGENYIKEAIDCILNQTYKNFELLIINDGSTDKSIEIINSYSDSRIKLLHNEKNSGERFTRNRAVYEAKGKYIAILDCDDLTSANRLELQYNYLEANPEISICGTFGTVIDEFGNEFGDKIMHTCNPEYINIEMLFSNQFINSSVMYKTEVGKAIGGYVSVDIPPDYAFFSRISEKYKMANIPEYLVQYREHSQGISKTKINQLREGEIEILKNLYHKFDLPILLIHVPHSFTKGDFSEITDKEISNFFKHIINTNKNKNIFSTESFNFVVFPKWYSLVINYKHKKGALEFYKTAILNNYKTTWKQRRKLFKLWIKF